MVVALSEEVWFRTYESQLSNMDLASRCLRYVDNRWCLPDSSWTTDPAFELFLHPDFYGKPIVLETELTGPGVPHMQEDNLPAAKDALALLFVCLDRRRWTMGRWM